MSNLDAVRVGVRVLATPLTHRKQHQHKWVSGTRGYTLEILATHQTSIHIVIEQRDRAQLLKVKVKYRPINGVQIWTVTAQLVF